MYHRDLDSIPPEDTLLLSLEENEHVKYTSAFQVPTLSNEINSLIAIG